MKVSVLKIIISDYLSLMSISFPIIGWVLYLDAKYTGVLHTFFSKGRMDKPGDPLVFLVIAILFTIIFLPILSLRISKITSHFKSGLEVMGIIKSIKFFKDRGRIFYEYELNGKKYVSSNAIHKSNYVKSLRLGQEIQLIVKTEQPEIALIKDMYIKA